MDGVAAARQIQLLILLTDASGRDEKTVPRDFGLRLPLQAWLDSSDSLSSEDSEIPVQPFRSVCYGLGYLPY